MEGRRSPFCSGARARVYISVTKSGAVWGSMAEGEVLKPGSPSVPAALIAFAGIDLS